MSELKSIEQAQERISKALDRAQAGEDRELAQQVRERGERFARLLAGAIRLTRIHALQNDAFKEPVAQLTEALAELYELLGLVQLIMVEDQVYVNDIRIRFELESNIGRDLTEMWNRHDVGGAFFHGPLEPAHWRAIVAFVYGDPPDEGGARRAFQTYLDGEGLSHVQLQPPFRFRLHGEQMRLVPKNIQQVYNVAAGAVGGVWDDMAAGRSLNILPVRKAVTELAEMDSYTQDAELALGTRKSKLPAVTRHSVQVATLSLLLGRELGLSEAQLSDLGATAFLHDMGYGADEDGFPPPFERHGSGAVRIMLQQRGFHEARIIRMLACLHHHMPYDQDPRPTLYARIIRIADDFDTLTRFRVGQGPKEAPPLALAKMYAARGKLYDPFLLQLFVNRVGMFPPGSILELSDGTWVTVVSGVRKPEWFDKPMTRVVRTATGDVQGEHLEIDLAVQGTVRKVVRPTDQ